MEALVSNRIAQLIRNIISRKLLLAGLLLTTAASLLAREKNEPKTNSVFLFTFDNDAFKLMNETDKYYSYGLFFGYQNLLSQESKLNRFVPFGSNNSTRNFFGTVLYLQGFTPIVNTPDAIPSTRPFAGILALKSGLTSVNSHRLIKVALEIGVRGPASGAEKVQTGWHDFTNIDSYPGWKDQLSNKLLINSYANFAFPISINKAIELIPETELALGSHNTYAQQAIMLRLGIFNDISKSALYNTHIGTGENSKKEIFITGKIFFRALAVDATFSSTQAKDIGLGDLDKDNFIGGFEIKLQMQSRQTGLFLGYTKKSSDSNFTLRHSFGSIGFNHLL